MPDASLVQSLTSGQFRAYVLTLAVIIVPPRSVPNAPAPPRLSETVPRIPTDMGHPRQECFSLEASIAWVRECVGPPAPPGR